MHIYIYIYISILTLVARSKATHFVDAGPGKVGNLSWRQVECNFDAYTSSSFLAAHPWEGIVAHEAKSNNGPHSLRSFRANRQQRYPPDSTRDSVPHKMACTKNLHKHGNRRN